MLTQGDQIPKLDIIDDLGKTISTSDLLDKKLVLYFYPKDDTPGCTTEASEFRDLYRQFEKKDVRVVGVSRDSIESHQKFKKKYSIPFTLISDTDSKLCDAFGVITEKNMYGKKSMGVQRSTFVIEKSGKIANAWPKVKVDGHVEEVLASLT
ncbi:MAG: peroxiredoxin [Candidatus Eremiobacteraeota bacterium]|nr:peroxiredoxin [Candidatus Eremiobacteraeota bacterium]